MVRWLGQWLLSARRAKRTKRVAADRALSLMGLSIILVALKDTAPSERMATCPSNMAHELRKSALGYTGDSVSTWTSHEESDAEQTLAVCEIKSHQVRTVRNASKGPWITNESAPMGCAQFEPSWLVDRATPRGARRSRKPKPRHRMPGVLWNFRALFFCSKYFWHIFCELYYEPSTFLIWRSARRL